MRLEFHYNTAEVKLDKIYSFKISTIIISLCYSKLHNEELRNLSSSPRNNLNDQVPRRMSRVGHVA
jgi:hypothetical protein